MKFYYNTLRHNINEGLYTYMYIHVYIYFIHTHTHTYIYIYIYIYIFKSYARLVLCISYVLDSVV